MTDDAQPGSLTRSRGVLVVDDEPAIRRVLELAFRSDGFAVWSAAGLTEAVETYTRYGAEIDLVLLDIRMPGGDGTKVLATLRDFNPNLICCFLSGDFGPYSEAELRALPGVAEVFAKPFSPAAVLLRCRGLTQTERRSSPRLTNPPVRFLVHRLSNGGGELQCWTRNRSQGGIALWAQTGPLPVGVQLQVRPAGAAEEEPWSRVEVRHCEAQADGWVIGCQVLSAPT